MIDFTSNLLFKIILETIDYYGQAIYSCPDIWFNFTYLATDLHACMLRGKVPELDFNLT